jgi:hypothetical protein
MGDLLWMLHMNTWGLGNLQTFFILSLYFIVYQDKWIYTYRLTSIRMRFTVLTCTRHRTWLQCMIGQVGRQVSCTMPS